MELSACFLGSASVEGKIERTKCQNAIYLAEYLVDTTEVKSQAIGAVARHASISLDAQFTVAITRHTDILKNGDVIKLIPERGMLVLPDITAIHVVSCVLAKHGKILLVKRSEKVGSFRGYWAVVSGHVEKGDRPYQRALREIHEETGIGNPRFIRTGEIVFARDKNKVYAVHPFLFDVNEEPKLDWEHTEYQWILPEELGNYTTVPKLREVVYSVIHR